MDEVFGSDNFISLITFKKTSGAGSPSGGNGGPRIGMPLPALVREGRNAGQVPAALSREDPRRGVLADRGSERAASQGDTRGDLNRRVRRPTPQVRQSDLPKRSRQDSIPSSTQRAQLPPEEGGLEDRRTRHVPPQVGRPARARTGTPRATCGTSTTFPPLRSTTSGMTPRPRASAIRRPTSSRLNAKVVERCLLMTTDPGDLVLDPTCGSGTTAVVAEKWGRRWITTDTSRVALALARTRINGRSSSRVPSQEALRHVVLPVSRFQEAGGSGRGSFIACSNLTSAALGDLVPCGSRFLMVAFSASRV